MPEPVQLNVHDMTVSEIGGFDGRGNPIKQTQVEFYVGNHGPFTISGKPEDLTGAEIRRRIESKVQELRIALSAQAS